MIPEKRRNEDEIEGRIGSNLSTFDPLHLPKSVQNPWQSVSIVSPSNFLYFLYSFLKNFLLCLSPLLIRFVVKMTNNSFPLYFTRNQLKARNLCFLLSPADILFTNQSAKSCLSLPTFTQLSSLYIV